MNSQLFTSPHRPHLIPIALNNTTDMIKRYIGKLNNPVDNYTYFMGFAIIPDSATITLEQIGGSGERCTCEIKEGDLYITTPHFTTNPEAIKIYLTPATPNEDNP